VRESKLVYVGDLLGSRSEVVTWRHHTLRGIFPDCPALMYYPDPFFPEDENPQEEVLVHRLSFHEKRGPQAILRDICTPRPEGHLTGVRIVEGARQAWCCCGWVGPRREALGRAADDGAVHESDGNKGAAHG
jgi:hypothetical protein